MSELVLHNEVKSETWTVPINCYENVGEMQKKTKEKKTIIKVTRIAIKRLSERSAVRIVWSLLLSLGIKKTAITSYEMHWLKLLIYDGELIDMDKLCNENLLFYLRAKELFTVFVLDYSFGVIFITVIFIEFKLFYWFIMYSGNHWTRCHD